MLSNQDSNLDKQYQKLLCYLYTIRQFSGASSCDYPLLLRYLAVRGYTEHQGGQDRIRTCMSLVTQLGTNHPSAIGPCITMIYKDPFGYPASSSSAT